MLVRVSGRRRKWVKIWRAFEVLVVVVDEVVREKGERRRRVMRFLGMRSLSLLMNSG